MRNDYATFVYATHRVAELKLKLIYILWWPRGSHHALHPQFTGSSPQIRRNAGANTHTECFLSSLILLSYTLSSLAA